MKSRDLDAYVHPISHPTESRLSPTADHVAKLNGVSADVTVCVPSSPGAPCWIIREKAGSRDCGSWGWMSAIAMVVDAGVHSLVQPREAPA